jgi:hypothetical protein
MRRLTCNGRKIVNMCGRCGRWGKVGSWREGAEREREGGALKMGRE